jgi:hypothetical protein
MEKAICILKDKCFYGIMKQYSIIWYWILKVWTIFRCN